ncbi:hypothetical protein TcG_01707 [Trypanosoma cruzi]|nr:hypothetical protein TcBrA4_0057320 [Trypanosoma cruzi]RNF23096.1 hypothetical protein TcG_01707 [Trypanosoma cruzi]
MKRERQFTVNDEDAQRRRAQTDSGDDETLLKEEILTVEETQTVLVRLPCLDFFRDAHICEEAAANGRAEATHEGDERHPSRFRADGLTFKSGTLETAHPVVVLRTKEYGEMEFEGSWVDSHEKSFFGAPSSNRVVVQLCERGDEQTEKRIHGSVHDASGSGSGAFNEPRSVSDKRGASTGVGVASLLKHPSVGITADEARGRKRARNESWGYGRIDVPCATLVLRRVK